MLKGPQGALYGRNAIGGAIIITTRSPPTSSRATFKAGYDNGTRLRGAARRQRPARRQRRLSALTVNYYDTDGFIHNLFLGE